jgi:hypothetical protein
VRKSGAYRWCFRLKPEGSHKKAKKTQTYAPFVLSRG